MREPALGVLVTSDCGSSSPEELRELNRSADAVMAALRDIARRGSSLGCSPPRGWIWW
ncbi:hypothetical protein ENSA5_47120 [Enhygromyxa salina]|uniref:Uncharacterized protein n=1 Tax=Enhygromyxa salina TaxID=215803 RepID=A0A2S9XIU5_9BACT|nr:hypothetical protein [Enhygromyxa salina]PRP92799.1 hypothetical protein ENSA5_47120 [Enhygromyxa salina]